MHKLILIPFIVFGFIFTEGIFREKMYKAVDEKGTINFSDNPTSSVIRTKEGAAKQDGAEVLKRNEEALKRNEMANRRPMTDDEIKAILLTRPTWRGSASSPGWGSSGTVRTGRS